MNKTQDYSFFDRELSWLSFNARVLQEANDPTVPLYERIKFLAIYSSNLDEFFRVRVASLRSLLSLKKKSIEKLDFDPATLLDAIHATVTAQQEEFGTIFRDQILPELRREGIVLIDDRQVDQAQAAFLQEHFRREVKPHLKTAILNGEDESPFLENKCLYLAVELWPAGDTMNVVASAAVHALVGIPSAHPRFVRVPGDGSHRYVIFVDDVIRLNLGELFPSYTIGGAYEVKLTRDAELFLEDEFSGDLIERIKKGLRRRETGAPSRFLYDLRAPHALVKFLRDQFNLADEDLVPGAKHHNFSDFFGFPRFGRDDLTYQSRPPLPHRDLDAAPSMLAAVAEKDRLVSFPYQKFDYIIRFLDEAADDPRVEAIWMTLYRVADESAVTNALIRAAQRGKHVTVFVELKARFDEKTNVAWAERMQEYGVQVHYHVPGLKVHAKLALVARREDDGQRLYAYLGTGNFNEETALIYADHGVFTADERLTQDVRKVFGFITGEIEEPEFEHLLVAPISMRKGFYRLIQREIAHVQEGRQGRMTLKLNNLEDHKMIARLYEASKAGVTIRMLIRSICCLVPGVEGQSENIYATGIVDRFLEHARIYLFHNDSREDMYMASADWMKRNLSRRVEVAFPIYDPDIRRDLRAMLDLQMADNRKARIIDAHQQNEYVHGDAQPPLRAQTETYKMLQLQADIPLPRDGFGSEAENVVAAHAARLPTDRPE